MAWSQVSKAQLSHVPLQHDERTSHKLRAPKEEGYAKVTPHLQVQNPALSSHCGDKYPRWANTDLIAAVGASVQHAVSCQGSFPHSFDSPAPPTVLCLDDAGGSAGEGPISPGTRVEPLA